MKDKTLGYILMSPILMYAIGLIIITLSISPLISSFFIIYIIIVLMFLIGLVKITR